MHEGWERDRVKSFFPFRLPVPLRECVSNFNAQSGVNLIPKLCNSLINRKRGLPSYIKTLFSPLQATDLLTISFLYSFSFQITLLLLIPLGIPCDILCMEIQESLS